MTPKDKPLIMIHPKLQLALLIFIATQGTALLYKVFTFTGEYSKQIENHSNRIDFLEGRTKNLEAWKDIVVNKEYELRQGRANQIQIP